MGFWELMLAKPTTTTTTTATTPRRTPLDIYTHYFSSYSANPLNGEQTTPYSFSGFRESVRNARNQGLNIDSSQAHAMRMLEKHGDEWFDENGNLRDNLSRRQAKRATKFRDRATSYYRSLLPKIKKAKKATSQKAKALWAAKNFLKNGYDLKAANQYYGITDYNGLADLWQGDDVEGVKAGGIYGDKAKAAELNFYNNLSAPQKRAYLAQRELWIKNGIISGDKLATLDAVTEEHMKDYVRLHLSDWYKSYYGDSFEDEYLKVNDPKIIEAQRTLGVYNSSLDWKPETSPVRTDGFITAAKKSKIEKVGKNTLIDLAKKLLKLKKLDPSGSKFEEKDGKLYIDGIETTIEQLKNKLKNID